MTAITTRTTQGTGATVKNSPLSNFEVDTNFINLNNDKMEASEAVSTNTANLVVRRDASGNFSAGTITATLSGSATSAGTATNLSGGSAGTVPYQSAAGTTAQLSAGSNGQLLRSNGAAAPTWMSQSSMVVGSASNASNATNYNNVAQVTYSESVKAGLSVTGGGDISVSGNRVIWSTRFIVMSSGRGSNFSTDGYFDINCPTSGQITGLGGAANQTATAAGILLNVWEALYYILPVGSASSSVATNFRVVDYTSDVDIPHNWIRIAARNGDGTNLFTFCNGVVLEDGQTASALDFSQKFRIRNSLGVGTPASGTAGQIRASNNITAYYSSDKTLKENIVNIENPLDKVKQLNGVTFDWKQEYIDAQGGEDEYFMRRHDVGVIAQEVEQVLPEIVATRDDGTKAVKYDRIVAVLIEAMKEQQLQIESLQREVEMLKVSK